MLFFFFLFSCFWKAFSTSCIVVSRAVHDRPDLYVDRNRSVGWGIWPGRCDKDHACGTDLRADVHQVWRCVFFSCLGTSLAGVVTRGSDRDLPDLDRDLPDLDRDLSDLDRDVPDLDRDLPGLDRDLPDLDRDLPDLDRGLPGLDRDLPDLLVDGAGRSVGWGTCMV